MSRSFCAARTSESSRPQRRAMKPARGATAQPTPPPPSPVFANVADKSIGIAPDPASAPVVRKLFERALRGQESDQELTRWARTQGLRSKRGAVLKTMVSNYTIIDGSVSVVLRSPFDVLARGARTGEWWS
jgi:hypothetical protein